MAAKFQSKKTKYFINWIDNLRIIFKMVIIEFIIEHYRNI